MMTFRSRSRRSALDRALEDLVSSREPADDVPELAVARALRGALSVEVDASLADRHLQDLAAVPVPVRGRRVHAPSWRRRTAFVLTAATLLVAGAMAGVGFASQGALPGDVLYPVKRATEALRLVVERDPTDRARLHMQLAEERLTELAGLLERRRGGEDVDVGSVMSAFGQEIESAEADVSVDGGDDIGALISDVIARIDKHVAKLTQLRDTEVPEQARAAVQRAIDNAQRAKERVSAHGRGRNGDRGKPDDTPGKGPGSSGGNGRGNAGGGHGND